MMKVALITGTRPQIIKSAPLIKELIKEPSIDFEFIHTGQHYDDNMFKSFIREFDLPEPLNLDILDNYTYSFVNTLRRLTLLWKEGKYRPALVIIPGDTESAFAGAFSAAQYNIPVAHLEAGVREYDMTMAEERNRRMIDHIASLLLVPTQDGWSNLVSEKVLGKMLLVGDTNYDLFYERKTLFASDKFSQEVHEKYNTKEEYVLLTIHRAANVDNMLILGRILKDIARSGKRFIFPIHPRTRKIVELTGLDLPNIEFIEPVSYDTMMNLVIMSSLVVTDSGGLQKEAYFANIPCVTLREITAWCETVEYGANMLVGITKIAEGIEKMYGFGLDNPSIFGDGHAARAIVDYISSTPIKLPKKNNWIGL